LHYLLHCVAIFSFSVIVLSFHAVMELSVLRTPNERGWIFFHAAPRVHRQMHRHVELELNLVVRGSARYLLRGRRYELRPRHAVWLFPAQDHLLLGQSADFRMWVAVFSRETVEASIASPDAAMLREPDPEGEFCQALPAVAFAELDRLCHRLSRSEDANVLAAGLSYLAASAWSACRAAEPFTAGEDIHPAVAAAARLLRDEAEPLSLEQLAARAGLSASRLSRLFRRQTGQPVTEFRNRRRLERFLALYEPGGERTMLAAALDAGFGSYPQFHRVFRGLTGLSPAHYFAADAQAAPR